MTEHDDEFDRWLMARLRAHEGRVPGAAVPDLDTIGSGSTRPHATRGWVALVAAAGVAAGLILALILNARPSPPTGDETASPSPTSVQPSAVRYEAVFLRRDMVVVGIDSEGQEREIASLRDGGSGFWPAYPAGAVTPTGLLALATSDDGGLFHWEIVDLHRPQAQPIVVAGILEDRDMLRAPPYFTPDGRGGVFWGPGQQVAIAWYERGADGNVAHMTIVDGRTGAASSVDAPAAVEPYWTSDGSGIFLGRRIEAGSYVFDFLQPDGTVTTTGTTQIVYSGTSRRYRSDGLEIGDAVLPLDGLDISDMAWTAAGDGAWLAIHSPDNGHGLTIVRMGSSSERQTVATLHDAVGEPATSRPDGHFIGLAPDDSMMVLSMDSVTKFADGSSGEGRPRTLVNPESGASFVIDGSFVGWLAVDR